MIDSPPVEPTSPPGLHVELAQVCVVDGIWQDAPDHLAAFDENRLDGEGAEEEGNGARGRGNLYLLLDVSGDVEGRAEIERELLETLRREYSRHRGSITFGLSEALRAANTNLFDLNLQAPREARRMAGVSTVVLRGTDLYIAQAGPAVVYVEVNGTLHRYPADSDWFSEDSPVIAPQGNASPPLGVRREFTCDLFHCAVAAGDVFVVATRPLTQLASTEELAAAFKDRAAEDIANYLEEVADGSDLSALVAELVDPRDIQPAGAEPPVETAAMETPAEEASAATEKRMEAAEPPTSSEPEVEPALAEQEAAAPAAAADQPESAETAAPDGAPTSPQPEPEYEIPWGATPGEEEEGPAEPKDEEEPEPAMAASAAPEQAAAVVQAPSDQEASAEKVARLREERRLRREAQLGAIGRVFGSIGRGLAAAGGAMLLLVALAARSAGELFGLVDWKRVRARINRWLNSLFYLAWNGLALLVRLMLPGQPGKQTLIPRRQSKKPVWLKGVAVILPILFAGMAFASYYQQGSRREDQAAALAQNARTLLVAAQAKMDTDRPAAKQDLAQAQIAITQALSIQDSASSRQVLADIQDQMNVANGVTVLKDFTTITRISEPGVDLAQVIADNEDLYFFDRGNQRIYHYTTGSGGGKSDAGDGSILQRGARIGSVTVDQIRDIAWAQDGASAARGQLIALTSSAILQYDPANTVWHAYPVTDAGQWGNIRALGSFNGNLYLLDGGKNQIWKYVPTSTGYAPTAVPYLPANAEVDLSRAVDMAIDGRIWVLNGNGSVLRFESGQSRPFDVTGLETPLKSGTSIYTRADSQMASLYIVDGAGQRIVELDKNGRFVRQFKPSAQNAPIFANLKSLFASPSNRKFYLISGNAIYMTDIK